MGSANILNVKKLNRAFGYFLSKNAFRSIFGTVLTIDAKLPNVELNVVAKIKPFLK